MKTIIQSLKGTRDFYPEDMAARNWLYQNLRQVSEAFGYQEYEGPFLESIDLYAAKSGEELVKEQSFVFPDRSGELITLRPELTPSLTRMIAQRQKQLVYPLRWWSFGPFWRYERPQKGRTREFFQWNIDLIGIASPEADAELITIIATFFKKVGLLPSVATILVNNRQLLDTEFAALGIPPDQRPITLRWIDRRSKLTPENWEAYGLELGIKPDQLDGMYKMLANQNLWQKSGDLVRLFSALEASGVAEYVRFDSNIVRGLDYYTGTVFEAFDISGEVRRAILGGGRYDNLLADVGGEALPAVGFAMGDVVINLVLQAQRLLPVDLGRTPASVLVTIFDMERMPASLSLAAELRQAGVNTICYPEATKLPKQFKYADRLGIRLAAVIGPDEAVADQVTVKNLVDGAQQTLPRQQAVAWIRQQVG
jgi:histidyl-tRNA synthetase